MSRVAVVGYPQLLAVAQQHNNTSSSSSSSPETPLGAPNGATTTAPHPLLTQLVEALGPQGPGLLAVTGVPGLQTLRHALLPLARTLALLPPTQRSQILKNHGLGADVPLKGSARPVSSFVAQLIFGLQGDPDSGRQPWGDSKPRECWQQEQGPTAKPTCEGLFEVSESASRISSDFASACLSTVTIKTKGDDLSHLGVLFKQLGALMVEVGLLVARLCDMAICRADLEQAIWESQTAKARLIHYHSLQENSFLLATSKSKSRKVLKKLECSQTHESSHDQDTSKDQLWQQWHFDYGVFTVLTAPMFLSPSLTLGACSETESFTGGNSELSVLVEECRPPDRHTELKILNSAIPRLEFVSVPASSLIVQVGEAAEILTGGALCATAHCVCRPTERTDVSRETFVVFLQPAWQKSMVSPDGAVKTRVLHAASDNTGLIRDDSSRQASLLHTHASNLSNLCHELAEIQSKIPPLGLRWKDGCTFAEFSRETTRQYYGVDGVQSTK